MGGFEDAVAVFVNRAALRVELCLGADERQTQEDREHYCRRALHTQAHYP